MNIESLLQELDKGELMNSVTVFGSLVGMLQAGKADSATQRNASKNATIGIYQPGTDANCRHHIARDLTEMARGFDAMFRKAFALAQHVYVPEEKKNTTEAAELEMLFREESQSPGMLDTLAELEDDICTASTRLGEMLTHHVGEAKAMEQRRTTDIAGILLYSMLSMQFILGRRARIAANISTESGQVIGLPVIINHHIERCAAAVFLRDALRCVPEIEGAVTAFDEKSIQKSYQLNSGYRALMEDMTYANARMQCANEDARTHVRLGEALKEVGPRRWRHASTWRPDTDRTSFFWDTGQKKFVYMAMKSGKQLREAIEIQPSDDDASSENGTGASKEVPTFLSTNGRLSVTTMCLYAGISPEMLGKGSMMQLEKMLAGVRGEFEHALSNQPLLQRSLRLFQPVRAGTNNDDLVVVTCEPEHRDAMAGVLQNLVQDDAAPTEVAGLASFFYRLERKKGRSEATEDEDREDSDDESGSCTVRCILRKTGKKKMKFRELRRLLDLLGMERDDSAGKGDHIKFTNPASGHASTLDTEYTGPTTDLSIGFVSDMLGQLALTNGQIAKLPGLLENL